jgi:hypothetical protein
MSADIIHVPLNKTYNDNLEFLRVSDLGATFFAHKPIPNLVVIQLGHSRDIFETEFARSLVSSGGGEITLDELQEGSFEPEGGLLFQRLQKLWGARPNMQVGLVQMISDELYRMPSKRWAMSFLRS